MCLTRRGAWKVHIAVDMRGLPHAIAVTTAEVTDGSGALMVGAFEHCRSRGFESVDGRRKKKQTDFSDLLVYDVCRWGRFQDVDESAYDEYVLKRAGIEGHVRLAILNDYRLKAGRLDCD